MKKLITLLLALFISGHAYSHEDDSFNPYRKSDEKLVGVCIMLEDLSKIWFKEHLSSADQKNHNQAQQDLKFAKEYSTIYKDLDCREVLKSKL
tara:strand:- start:491 stop:769 length:279 start_codon:yes stop_codon:yes gene_type:complete